MRNKLIQLGHLRQVPSWHGCGMCVEENKGAQIWWVCYDTAHITRFVFHVNLHGWFWQVLLSFFSQSMIQIFWIILTWLIWYNFNWKRCQWLSLISPCGYAVVSCKKGHLTLEDDYIITASCSQLGHFSGMESLHLEPPQTGLLLWSFSGPIRWQTLLRQKLSRFSSYHCETL